MAHRRPAPTAAASPYEPVPPAYGGGCVADIIPAVLGSDSDAPSVLPEAVLDAGAIVLLVLDGLGAEQLDARPLIAPTLTEMRTATITTVAPTTTATALTSIATGVAPGQHGVVGYRIHTWAGNLNVLRWRTPMGDARWSFVPEEFQPVAAFANQRPVALQNAAYADTGFSRAYLRDARRIGYDTMSSLPGEVLRLLGAGESFVYAYYEGIDMVAHMHAFGEPYDTELGACDRMMAELLTGLPRGAAVVAIADHGLVDCSDGRIEIDPSVIDHASTESGEARFRWLHALPGRSPHLFEAAAAAHGDQAWVLTVDEILDRGWLGPEVTEAARSRLGDVALVARDHWAFDWPGGDGTSHLIGRHGSLTPAEMLVPLLTYIS